MLLLATAMAVLAAGCGASYRPVVTAINPVGPAAQPTKYAVAVSQPSPTANGLITIVDFSGDTILVNANLGVAPYYLAVAAGGGDGYTLNGDGTFNHFSIATTLQTYQVQTTTLLPGTPASNRPSSIFPQASYIYVTEPGRSSVGQFALTTLSLRQELPIQPGASSNYIVGTNASSRAYIVNSSTSGGNGQVTPLETGTGTLDTPIPVGVNPVYGVMTADTRRAFILNQGDNTVSVLNSQANTLDSSTLVPRGVIPVGISPVWADFAPSRTELVVANAGNGTTRGSVSIISIPLCSSYALPSNPNCDPNNPVDAYNPTDGSGFGQILANVPVGVNPQVVSVLQDGTRAYVANSGDTVPCAPALAALSPAIPITHGCGTVSVVDLTTNTVTATIPVAGHPNFVVTTQGTPTGKVYVTSAETSLMTIIRTDLDQASTYVDLQGAGVQVRVTAP